MNSPSLGPMHVGSNDSIGPYLVAASGFYFAHGVRPLVLKFLPLEPPANFRRAIDPWRFGSFNF